MSSASVMSICQYLTFKLEDELFALDIARVREVLDFTEMTNVPRMPGFVRGVINLRGSVVPVVDLRLKFGMPRCEKTVNTCIVILEVAVDGQSCVLGALVDSVQEVIDMEPEQIGPAPRIGTRLNTEFITGMGRRDDSFLVIVDIDKVFSAAELEQASSASSCSDPHTH